MDLYQVRSPWVRRSALIVLMVPIGLLVLAVATAEGAWAEFRREWGDTVWSIKRAWRGE